MTAQQHRCGGAAKVAQSDCHQRVAIASESVETSMQTELPETILCAVDFNELSVHALREAAMLARCGHSRLVAVYANWLEAPPYFTETQITDLREEMRRSASEAERSLAAFEEDALGGSAPDIEAHVIQALPAEGILAASASTGARLIVLGTHGRSGWNRWTLGSLAERVLRESAVPVLTVRSEPAPEIRHILCPVSDSAASRSALAKAVSLAACLDATVTALHVEDPRGDAGISNLCAWIPAEARSRCNIRELALRGNAAEEIVRLSAAEPYDLIVLGAPRRRFFEGMVMGTTAIRTVRHAACPVLTVPALPGS
jgi:nucleotide-binding universal stress UspA family protein